LYADLITIMSKHWQVCQYVVVE